LVLDRLYSNGSTQSIDREARNVAVCVVALRDLPGADIQLFLSGIHCEESAETDLPKSSRVENGVDRECHELLGWDFSCREVSDLNSVRVWEQLAVVALAIARKRAT